jgi:hypothetical protein
MDKNKTKKQSDKDTLAEVTKEMAKPRVAMSAREHSDTYGNRSSGPKERHYYESEELIMSSAADDKPLNPMELLRRKVAEELAASCQTSTGMLLTPILNACLKILGVRATLVT